jgi:hypothetical protein
MTNRTSENRESPVSFRPGKLRAALRLRALRGITEGQIAKRDLGRYYLLLGQALAEVHLTKREASYLAVADFDRQVFELNSGNPFTPEHVNPSDYILELVRRPIKDAERRDRPASKLVYRVADKVEAMSALERAALMDAIDRLPGETEEEIGDLGNWSLIGFPLADDPVDVGEARGNSPLMLIEIPQVSAVAGWC